MVKKQALPLRGRGGRPSREEASKLEDKILDAAAALFFSEGYGAASIEEIVRRAQISKRTFYARFENKAAVFRAVVHRVIQQLRPPSAAVDQLFSGKNIEAILRRIAPVILQASLSPSALSLHRVLLSESARFPELARIMQEQGSRHEAIRRIAGILEAEAGSTKKSFPKSAFAAEQFLVMLTATPQRRALEFGITMKKEEIDNWSRDTVELFLKGYLSDQA